MGTATRRLAEVAGAVGTRHPDYATALNQLALNLIMQGEPDRAEPLLREALEVRRGALGEAHPDFATNLSSLAGLLWASGRLDEAEPLLRRAVEVRTALLGVRHPKTVVSRNSLDQLLEARAAAGPADPGAPLPAPSTPAGDVAAPAPDPLDEAGRRLDELTREFQALRGLLEQSAAGLLRRAAPPAPEVVPAAEAASRRFHALAGQLAGLATTLGASAAPGRLSDLEGLARLVPELRAADRARREERAAVQRAVETLQQVELLSCPTWPAFPALAACRGQARALRTLAETPGQAPKIREAVRGVADGTHPFAALVALTGAGESTPDAAWADWFDAIEAGFGSALAVAVARGRVLPATF